MPIEIRELVIRATVDPHSTGKGKGDCGTDARGEAGEGRNNPSGDVTAGDTLVQTCVREVMRILEEKRER